MGQFHATTIVAVRRGDDDICIGGDGQVTMGETAIMKHGAKKVRKIYKNTVISGFAGSVADAFSLTETRYSISGVTESTRSQLSSTT